MSQPTTKDVSDLRVLLSRAVELFSTVCREYPPHSLDAITLMAEWLLNLSKSLALIEAENARADAGALALHEIKSRMEMDAMIDREIAARGEPPPKSASDRAYEKS